MIKPCIVHSAAKVHYHEYSLASVRKFLLSKVQYF